MKILIGFIALWVLFQLFITFYVMPTGARMCMEKGGILAKSAYGYSCVDKDFKKIDY